MKNMLKKIISSVSPDIYTRIIYNKVMKNKLNLNNPKYFSEKIQWLKLKYYPTNEIAIHAGDKYGMHEYVKSKGLEFLLIELVQVLSKERSQIDFDKLPEEFVMKKSNSSGDNRIITNKKEIDMMEIQILADKWINDKSDYSKLSGELHYSKMKTSVVFEKLVHNINREVQIFCFNGIPRSFQEISYSHSLIHNQSVKKIEKKTYHNIDELKYSDFSFAIEEVSQILSRGIPLVRLDFIFCDEGIFLGEMTFTPSSGFHVTLSEERQIEWGNWLILPK